MSSLVDPRYHTLPPSPSQQQVMMVYKLATLFMVAAVSAGKLQDIAESRWILENLAFVQYFVQHLDKIFQVMSDRRVCVL